MNIAAIAAGLGAVPPAEWHAVAQILYREAELLDAGALGDWLRMLADPVEYRVLNRVTRDRASRAAAFDERNFLVLCDRGALEARIARLQTEFAWAEDPPVTTRRFVGNIRVSASGDDALDVKSSLLLYRARWDSAAFVSAERHDRWEQNAGGFVLTKRWAYLDHTVLPIENLAVFL